MCVAQTNINTCCESSQTREEHRYRRDSQTILRMCTACVCVCVFVLRGVYKSRITLLICLIKRKGTKSLLKTQSSLFKWITTNAERSSH